MQDRDDDADEDGHEDDGLAARSEPDDDEGAEGNFREGVQDDDVWFEDFAQGFAPPKEEGDGKAEHDGDGEPGEGLPQGDADVVEQASVRIEGGDRSGDAGGGTHDEGIDPAAGGDELPKPEQEGEEAEPAGSRRGARCFLRFCKKRACSLE